MTETGQLAQIAAGDVVCITGGPYECNKGQMLRVIAAHDTLLETVVMPGCELTYSDGFGYCFLSPGEIAVICRADVTAVS